MRILFLNGHPVWINGLPWGFRQLGHDVRIVVNLQKDYLIRHMEEFQPDLLVTVGWIHNYKPQNLKNIKEIANDYGCLHVYWATEDINFFEKWSLHMVRTVQPDVVFTINADCIPFYRDLGIPAFHLEFGYNPSLEPPASELPDPRYNHDLVLVANTYDEPIFRKKTIQVIVRPLIENGYDLVLCGKGWEKASCLNSKLLSKINYLGPIPFEDTFRAYKSAKITLNLQNQNQHKTQVTLRTFEIMGCGGFQLTARIPALNRLFIDRYHLVMSSSSKETLELVDYYLDHEKERQTIAKNGQAEVLSKHKYDKKAAYLLSCLAMCLP